MALPFMRQRSSKKSVLIIVVLSIAIIFLLSNRRILCDQQWQFYSPFRQQQLRSTRICCLILTTPPYFTTRATAVNATWGPRCDKYYFITEVIDQNLTKEEMKIVKQLPIAPIHNLIKGYTHLTLKSNQAFLFAYEHHLNDFDWFVKADDDTFLIVEHLRTFLSEQNSSEPITFGYNFKGFVKKGHHSGGASYVLSRESLRRFHEAYTSANTTCQKDGGAEDVAIARCLRTQGVYPGKSLDKKNREIFHSMTFRKHFRGFYTKWFSKYSENLPQTGYNCCSEHSVSFHYILPDEQYFIDFLLYRMRTPLAVGSQLFDGFNRRTEPSG